jgi:hypothetical protein
LFPRRFTANVILRAEMCKQLKATLPRGRTGLSNPRGLGVFLFFDHTLKL